MTRAGDEWSIDTEPLSIRGSSRTRLSFEPRDAMVEYRTGLRRALRNLCPVSGLALAARYAAPDNAFLDVENAALYNIGTSAYARLIADGLYCERTTSQDPRHHLSYALEPLPDLPEGPVLARLDVGSPTQVAKPGTWWAAFRPAALRLPRIAMYDSTFTVDLAVPREWTATRLANLIKPLLDGLIAALHTHDGSGQIELMSRLGSLGREETVWELLRDPTCDLLGSRALVRPYRDGIAWNPADERCRAFRVSRRADTHAEVTALIRATSP